MPEDAKEAFGHGIRAKQSKSGAVTFDVLALENSHAIDPVKRLEQPLRRARKRKPS